MGDRKRVLVIGLDGASWNIIKPLVKRGKLPAIEKLMKSGCYGDLESCIMPFTFPAWKCYSTGKNPGKLGVYWFLGVDLAGEKIVTHNSTSFKSEEIWDILGRNDITCGVLDMPTTYPPKDINGFMVSHGPTRLTGYTYPEELEEELKERCHYQVEPTYQPELDRDAAIPAIKQIIEQRFEVAAYLMREFDPAFCHITIFDIDTVQHFYSQEVVEDFWVLIDNGIKSLLDQFLDEKTCVILMSDHGQTELKGVFQIGKWLVENKLVVQKRRQFLLGALLYKLGLSQVNILRMIGRTRIIPVIRLYIPRGIRQRIMGFFPVGREAVSPDDPLGSIDWGQSKVIPVPGFNLYINGKLFGSEEALEECKLTIEKGIEKIQDPQTGRAFARVLRREDVYSGKYVENAPELIIIPEEGYGLGFSLRAKGMWDFSMKGWRRTHKLNGIFLACGTGIKEGTEIQGASIYDLVPTILHIFGVPISKDMDGKVLKELFKSDTA